MEENKKTNSKNIIIALAVLLFGSIGYTIYNNQEHKKVTDAIEVEKHDVEQNLDSMIAKYENAIAEKTSLSKELSLERDRIISLRDSIKNLKATDYALMRKFRKQIAELQETNKRLLEENADLTSKNKVLTVNLDSAKATISTQKTANDTLTARNFKLSEKVAIGSTLKVVAPKVLAMRQRNNGKLVETSRSRNTDAFRINFTVAKNEIAEKGERIIYVQIQDANGVILAPKGEFTLNDNTQVTYSDKSIINYLNEDFDIISLVEVKRDDVKAGVYTANIFIDNKFAGSTQITLK